MSHDKHVFSLQLAMFVASMSLGASTSTRSTRVIKIHCHAGAQSDINTMLDLN